MRASRRPAKSLNAPGRPNRRVDAYTIMKPEMTKKMSTLASQGRNSSQA